MNKINWKSGKVIAIFVFILLVILVCIIRSVNISKKKAKAAAEQKAAVTTTSVAPVTLTTAHAEITVTTTTVPKISEPECQAAAVYSVDTEELLYADNIDEKAAPASLTKLLTALTAIKYTDLDDVFTVGTEQYFVDPYSSLCYLGFGNVLTMNDLITGMLMTSGNDAAYTIAVSAARKESGEEYMEDSEAIEYFCGLMNKLAEEIGMKDSYFTNPDGWDDEVQYTTAADLLKLAEYALNDPTIQQIVRTHEKYVEFESGEPVTWINSNLLIDPYSDYFCPYATGVKTGTTLSAGNSLIASFEKNGKKYITVVEGCETDEDRYELTLKLFTEIVK